MTTPRKPSWKGMIYEKKIKRFFRIRNSQFEQEKFQPDAVDETKDDTEMWKDSSEVLWMWTRRASQISAEEGAEEGFENTMNSKDMKDQTMKSFLRTKLKFQGI